MLKKVSTMCLSLMLIMAVSSVQAEDLDQSPGSQSQSQQQGLQPDSQMNGQTDGQMQSVAGGQSNMTQLEPLVGKTVLDAQQSEIGEIQDIVVDQQSRQAKYVILGAGGFLGIGEDYHAVPWSALNIQATGDTVQSVSTSLDMQTITESPIVEMGTARSFDSRLKSQIDSYYQGKGVSIQSNGMSNGAAQEQPMQQQEVDIIPGQSNGTNGVGQPEEIEIIPRDTNGTNGTYGDGVRSGEPQSEVDQGDSVSPFGEQTNGQTNGTDSDVSSDTATQYRSGYAEGVNRAPSEPDRTDSWQTDSTLPQENGQSNGTGVYSQEQDQAQQQQGSVQTNGASQQFVWFTELSGREVKSSQDEQVGQLQDLVVDASQGDISFGLISMDEGTVAVPFSALQMQQDSLIVNAQMDTLRSLAFQSDNKPDFSDPAYQQNVYQQFGQQPPTVYGYVTPQQPQSLPPLEREYTRLFDSQNTETVSGRITKVEKRSADKTPQESMRQTQQQDSMSQQQPQSRSSQQSEQKSLHLTVQTDQGQTMQVHAGPEQFLKQRNLDLKEGDQVQITGSKAQVMGQEILIASRISKDGQEVMVRSTQGQPMWSPSQQSGSQMQSGQQRQTNGMTNGQSNGQLQQDQSQSEYGNGVIGSPTDSQLQQDQSQSQYGNGLIDSQMDSQSNGVTDGQSDEMKSDKEKDAWKSDETNGTNGQSDAMKSDQEKDAWKSDETNGTNGQSDGMKSDKEKDAWKSDETNGTNGESGLLQFRSDEQTTVSGTVQGSDAGTPGAMTAMDQAVLLKVQDSQGQSQTIYAGPRDFIQKKNMSFNDGDQITATGWKKTIAGQEVFIASKIEKDGQTLQLRDMQGNPEWKTEGSRLYNGTDSQPNSSQMDSNKESNSTY